MTSRKTLAALCTALLALTGAAQAQLHDPATPMAVATAATSAAMIAHSTTEAPSSGRSFRRARVTSRWSRTRKPSVCRVAAKAAM